MLFINAGNHYHSKPDNKNNEARTNIGLKKNKERRDNHIDTGNNNMFYVGNLNMAAGKILCPNKNKNKFDWVNRLY